MIFMWQRAQRWRHSADRCCQYRWWRVTMSGQSIGQYDDWTSTDCLQSVLMCVLCVCVSDMESRTLASMCLGRVSWLIDKLDSQVQLTHLDCKSSSSDNSYQMTRHAAQTPYLLTKCWTFVACDLSFYSDWLLAVVVHMSVIRLFVIHNWVQNSIISLGYFLLVQCTPRSQKDTLYSSSIFSKCVAVFVISVSNVSVN